jgi:hypothetical protein
VSFLSTAVQEILEQDPFCAVGTRESEPGGGATFTFDLPAATAAVTTTTTPSDRRAPE